MKRFFVPVAMAMILLLALASPAISGSCAWAPYKGSSSVDKTATCQYFMFKKAAIIAFSKVKNCTYEHETQIYDTKYVNVSSSKYWTGNLPRGYLDTQFCDTGGIDNITVGTCTAGDMSKEKWYYYTVALSPQKSKSATVRIKGQRGHLKIPKVYSTWNVFADETSPSLTIFTAPKGPFTWSY